MEITVLLHVIPCEPVESRDKEDWVGPIPGLEFVKRIPCSRRE
jgi:hypothetical protein